MSQQNLDKAIAVFLEQCETLGGNTGYGVRHFAQMHAYKVTHNEFASVIGFQKGPYHSRITVLAHLRFMGLGHETVDFGFG